MRDMVPPEGEDKSIRRIQINREGNGEREREAPRAERSNEEAYEEPVRRYDDPHIRGRKKWWQKFWIWAAIVILAIFILLALTPLFTKASVLVTPKSERVQIDGEFTTSMDELAEADIFYQSMTVEKVGEERVPATGEEEVSERSSGRIVVYNEFSDSSERLIANTRFQTPEGLVYRIREAIEIPGYTERGGEIIPGMLEVTVYADEAGESHNIESARFTIPGLEGDERFDKMYAESKTPMEGGFSGVRAVASEADVEQARESLRVRLEEEIVQEIDKQIPENFIYFRDGAEISYEAAPSDEVSSDGEQFVVVRERVVAEVPIFNKSALASFIASETLGTYDGEEVRIENQDGLAMEFTENEDGVRVLELEGSLDLVWVVNYDGLKEDLIGKSRVEVENILSGYSGVREAKVNISPFWKRTITDNPEKVLVEEELNLTN